MKRSWEEIKKYAVWGGIGIVLGASLAIGHVLGITLAGWVIEIVR